MAGYLSKIVLAGFLGRAFLKRQGDSSPAIAVALLAGLVPVFLAINLPYLGGLINFVLVIVGLGALVSTAYQSIREHVPQAA